MGGLEPALPLDADDFANRHRADSRPHNVNMRKQPLEIRAAGGENHDADLMRDSLRQFGEVAVDREDDVELVGSKCQQFPILDSRPSKLLNRTGLQVGKRSHERARHTLVNENAPRSRRRHERPQERAALARDLR
jgi:hypothetical protein